jgi:RNA polymerase sigma factor (sigma-70 family)
MSTAAFALQPHVNRDPKASGRIDVAALYPSLSRRLERSVRHDVDAPDAVIEDACQVAWIRLIRHAERVQPAAVFAWLAHTARNEARRQLRRCRHEVSLEAIVESGAAPSMLRPHARGSDQLADRERLLIVRQLPVRQQRITWLRAVGLSYAEIGRRTGDSGRTVERQLILARARLRAELAA